MRKILSVLLSFVFVLLPLSAKAEGKSAKAYLLMPLHSGTTLEEKNSDEAYSVAGLCKLPAILTLCRAFDNGLIDEAASMQVSQKASKVSGPTAFLNPGESVPAGELIKAAVMISAGDAIWTLMENAFGSEEVFLQNIGVVLEEAGVSLSLSSCLGTGTRFTCRDLLRLAEIATESKTFLRWCSVYMDSLPHQKGSATELVNANRMIRSYNGCFGLMTGSSRDDGYCGVFAARRNNMTYLCCVIGSDTSEQRFAEATRLFDYAFANYRLETPAVKGEPLLKEQEVLYGDAKTVDLLPHETVSLLLKKQDREVTPAFDLPEPLTAPLDPDTPVGSVTFTDASGNLLAVVELYPSALVQSNGYRDVLRRILAAYFS